VRAKAPYDGPPGGEGSKRGSCDALVGNQNKARPLADSSLAGPSHPMHPPQPNGLTTEPRLTANLLDPLVALHGSLSPPPRYCTQLHLTRHTSSSLFLPSQFSK
jgi:hypothetical protein